MDLCGEEPTSGFCLAKDSIVHIRTGGSFHSPSDLPLTRVRRGLGARQAGQFYVVFNLSRLDPLTDAAALGDSQIVVVLKIEPELRW